MNKTVTKNEKKKRIIRYEKKMEPLEKRSITF